MPGTPREEEIRRIAYEIWEKEGKPAGKDFEHYMRAEQAWDRRAASLREAPPTVPATTTVRPTVPLSAALAEAAKSSHAASSAPRRTSATRR